MVEKDRRTKNIQIRVTDNEKKSIEEQANKAGLSMAAYVRTTLLNNVQSAVKSKKTNKKTTMMTGIVDS